MYGFNPSGPSGNFVTDFGFETKITPDLASMISIGAAAGNSNIKNYDATAFSKWNDGLKDRYSQEYIDPTFTLASTETLKETQEYKLISKDEVKVLFNAFNNTDTSQNRGDEGAEDRAVDSSLIMIGKVTSTQVENNEIPSTAAGLTATGRRRVINSPIINKSLEYSVFWQEYLEKVNDFKIEQRAKNADNYETREEAKERAKGNNHYRLV